MIGAAEDGQHRCVGRELAPHGIGLRHVPAQDGRAIGALQPQQRDVIRIQALRRHRHEHSERMTCDKGSQDLRSVFAKLVRQYMR